MISNNANISNERNDKTKMQILYEINYSNIITYGIIKRTETDSRSNLFFNTYIKGHFSTLSVKNYSQF